MFFDVLHQIQVTPIVVSPSVCGLQSILTNEVIILLCLSLVSLYIYSSLTYKNKEFSTFSALAHLQALNIMATEHMIADVVTIIGTQNILFD